MPYALYVVHTLRRYRISSVNSREVSSRENRHLKATSTGWGLKSNLQMRLPDSPRYDSHFQKLREMDGESEGAPAHLVLTLWQKSTG